jgi:spermidine synthase
MRKSLVIAVFISGMSSLALEFSASRLLERTFGSSNLVWASIIGLILLYLAGGYFIGGIWADRSPTEKTFYQILIWAALTMAFIPLISRPVLQAAADAFDQLQFGILAGAFVAVIILLIIPVTLLGTASPFAIRLAVQHRGGVGKISGRIYAISTLGSFIGTFLPVLVLIPLIGTYRTILFFAGLLLLAGLAGLGVSCGRKMLLRYAWTPLVIAAILLWGLPGTDKHSEGQVYETESSYNYIQVIDLPDQYRILRLNEGQGYHSIYNPNTLSFNGPWELVLTAPFFNPPPYPPENVKSMAIIGLAAGTTARQATAVYGPIAIDGFEIDPKVVEVGRTYFDMNEPNLNVILQDGRWGLEHSPNHYQIISIDAYRPPYIPWHLTTQEFFASVHEHLTQDGVMVINIGRAPNDRRLVEALASTIQTSFPSIYVVDVPQTFNSVLFATVQPTTLDYFRTNLAAIIAREDVHPLLKESLTTVANHLQPAPAAGPVFTDDKAAIEWITNDMVLKYILSGDAQELKQ